MGCTFQAGPKNQGHCWRTLGYTGIWCWTYNHTWSFSYLVHTPTMSHITMRHNGRTCINPSTLPKPYEMGASLPGWVRKPGTPMMSDSEMQRHGMTVELHTIVSPDPESVLHPATMQHNVWTYFHPNTTLKLYEWGVSCVVKKIRWMAGWLWFVVGWDIGTTATLDCHVIWIISHQTFIKYGTQWVEGELPPTYY